MKRQHEMFARRVQNYEPVPDTSPTKWSVGYKGKQDPIHPQEVVKEHRQYHMERRIEHNNQRLERKWIREHQQVQKFIEYVFSQVIVTLKEKTKRRVDVGTQHMKTNKANLGRVWFEVPSKKDRYRSLRYLRIYFYGCKEERSPRATAPRDDYRISWRGIDTCYSTSGVAHHPTMLSLVAAAVRLVEYVMEGEVTWKGMPLTEENLLLILWGMP